MKKTWYWLVILGIVLMLAGCNDSDVTSAEESAYKKNTENLTRVEPKELSDLIEENTEELFVYFGRVTCPHCRDFVPLLHEQKPKSQTVYYLDTEDTQTNKAIKELRDRYEIETVPGFVKITADDYVKFDVKTEDLAPFFEK